MLLSLYHRLPPFARSAVASAHGYYLNGLRYGRETEGLVEEAFAAESWTPERWKSWREARLAQLLDRAARQVPYYRAQWVKRRQRGDQSSWDRLENWPILEKDAVRKSPQAFVAEDSRDKLYIVHTSGTSGTPIQLQQSRRTLVQWYALVEARSRRWYGVSRHDRWAILGGRLIVPAAQSRPPFWVWNQGMRQLYLSSFHLSPQWIHHYVEALRRYEITYIWGYTSSLYTMAQEILARGTPALRLKVAITNAEPVYGYQREAISAAFGCPVRETYGMAEMAAAAGECENGGMHLWPSVGVTEVVEDGRPVANGEPGELICTGLINGDMPLIRYRVRDRAALAPADARCECGRTLPMIQSLEGRSDDVLYTADGRRLGRLDPVLKGNLPVRELQIVQESLDRLRVRYVPAEGFTSATELQIKGRLREYMGEFQVDMEPVHQIERGANGKFRAVVCRLTEREIPCELR